MHVLVKRLFNDVVDSVSEHLHCYKRREQSTYVCSVSTWIVLLRSSMNVRLCGTALEVISLSIVWLVRM